MNWTYLIVTILLLLCLPWFLTLWATITMVLRIRRISDVAVPEPTCWPQLSVIVPACNEERAIHKAATTLLAQDYPNLQVLLINDRSSDQTADIIDDLASLDKRARAIHINVLPAGWLGKVHALYVGESLATGDFLLFTDADVCFSPQVLRRAVGYAIAHGIDHLCVVPDLKSRHLLPNLCIASAMRMIVWSQKPWRAEIPSLNESIGSGAFNLVRRQSFLATPGFEWLRMEVADDLGLGQMMKQSGGNVAVFVGTGDVWVPWYQSLSEVFSGLEKNAFAQAAHFSLWRGIALAGLLSLMTLAPFVAFLPLGVPHLWLIGATTILGNLTNAYLVHRWASFPLHATFLASPIGDLLLCSLMIWACIRASRRGGLCWRGTVYPTAALREGMRVRF